MQSSEVLDVIERLFVAAQHPDIVEVRRFGTDIEAGGNSAPGVAVVYRSGSAGYIWAAPPRPAPEPCPMPDELPGLRYRAQHTLAFLVRLLEAAQPSGLTAWRTVAFPGVGLRPAGLEVRGAEGMSVVLRVTSGSGPTGDPVSDEHAGYEIPNLRSAFT